MSLAGAKFPAKLKELLGQKMKDSGGAVVEGTENKVGGGV